MSLIERLDAKLKDKGIVLTAKHNTIYTAISDIGRGAPITNKAITGLATVVSDKINRFHGVILPCSRELEKSVKVKSTVKPDSLVDHVHIHVAGNQMNMDALIASNNVDPHAHAVFEDLPADVWFLEYEESEAVDAIKSAPKPMSDRADYLLMELPEGTLKRVHMEVFGNVSTSNLVLRNITTNPASTVADAFIALTLALGYRDGTLGVSNLPASKVRITHLPRLIAHLTTVVAAAESKHAELISSDVLISGLTKVGKDVIVNVVGPVYEKYLAKHNVSAILAYGAESSGDSTYRRVGLEAFLEGVPKYLAYYDESIRMSNMKAAIQHIEVLRLAYRISVTDYLNSLEEEELEEVGIPSSGIKVIIKHVDDFVARLAHEDLLDVTAICRTLAGDFIYNDNEFELFSSHMLHYAKVFPDLTPEEVATCATAALTMDYLESQYTVERS